MHSFSIQENKIDSIEGQQKIVIIQLLDHFIQETPSNQNKFSSLIIIYLSYNYINTSLHFYSHVQMRTASLNNKYIKQKVNQTNQIYIASIARERHRSISCKINKDNQDIKFQTRPDHKLEIFHQIVENKKRMVLNTIKRIFKLKEKPRETLFLYEALQKGSLDINRYKQMLINKPIYNYINLNISKDISDNKNKLKIKIFIKAIQKVVAIKIQNALSLIQKRSANYNECSYDKQNLQDTYEDKMTTTIKSFKSSQISYLKSNLCSIQLNKSSRNSSRNSSNRSRKNSTSNIINVTFTSVHGSPSIIKYNNQMIHKNQTQKGNECFLKSPLQNLQKKAKQHKNAMLSKQKDDNVTHIGQKRRKHPKIVFLEDQLLNDEIYNKMNSFYQ